MIGVRLLRRPATAGFLAMTTLLSPFTLDPSPTLAETEQWAHVQRTVDGDTVLLTTGERVRYIGIDTPELHHPRKPLQPYAREAKQFNRNLVEGKTVRLEFDVQRYDRYRRLLAYVYLTDGTFVNAQLIRQGYAQILTIPPNVKYSELFLKYQQEARENNRGLWGKQ
jgi:micrococcal nuclease